METASTNSNDSKKKEMDTKEDSMVYMCIVVAVVGEKTILGLEQYQMMKK